MANPTSELLVKVATDTKQLKAGLDSADKQTKGFAQNIQKHSKTIGIAMVAIGTAIVGVATKSVLSYAKMGDEVAKMAKRTGFSTEALSELRYAAELSGTSLAGVEKASRTLSGAILDAGFGLETYVRAFDKIGLSYEQLKSLSPEEQFLAVMESLAGLSDESERAALASDLFGRAGTQLLPMLSDGTEGLKDMRQEAHDLNLVFDKEASVAAEDLTDAMTDVKSSITGAGLAIAEVLIPAITPLLDKVTEVVKKIADFAEENETLTKVITGAGGLMIGLGGLILILPKLITAIRAVGHTLKTLMLNPVVALTSALALLGFGIYSLVKHHTDWNKVVEAATKVNEELEKSEGKLTKEVLEAQKAYNELRIAYGQLEGEELEQIQRSQEIIALWEDGTYVLNEATGALELYTEAEKALSKETDKAIAKQKELLGILGKLYPTGMTMKELQAYGEMLWARKRGITEIGGYTPGTAGFMRALGYTEYQHGGVVSSPTLALVGERGPEAIVPLDRMGGITINFTEPVFMEREESINKLADRIYRVIKKEQRLSFGGAYSG